MRRYFENTDVVYYDDFFTEEEYDNMFQELTMLCVDGMMLDSKEAGGATCPTGKMLRNNKGLPIETVMDNSSIIDIFNKKLPRPFNEFLDVSHLINYYSDGHYYDYHKDKSAFTAITIFHKTPKDYVGGDLTFKTESGIIIPKLNPRDLIIFPGILEHSVTTMVGGNRISVSRFMK